MRGQPLQRRLTAWAMLALQALVASGLPLPLAMPPASGSAAGRKLVAKDRSRPFPCMDNACGCDSAERCFTNCCCHTPAETLRWAQARGIEPAVIAALARRAVAAAPAPAEGGRCAAKLARPSCCEPDEPAEASCCAPGGHPVDDTTRGDSQVRTAAMPTPSSDRLPAADDEPSMRVVTLRAMLACGGIVAQWTAACVALPPPGIVTCEIPWPATGTVVMADERPLGAGSPPDVPPPRGC